jgi:adenine-specific DNA-methyltransferase
MTYVKTYLRPSAAASALAGSLPAITFQGDCLELLKQLPEGSVDLIVTSPPYCIGKSYEKTISVADFEAVHKVVLPEAVRVLRPGGSLCWQVGLHVSQQVVYPLEYKVFELASALKNLVLRNRIIWTFGHGLHTTTRFSGRHESVLWFTKSGAQYSFNLDQVRVPQKYPGKRHYKGPKRGQLSGDPLGKNPGDVWEIPNVKANHREKSEHPCQFPVALAGRLVRALSPSGGIVLDPFMGSGSSAVAALLSGRRFIGAEIDPAFVRLSVERILAVKHGTARVRPEEQPVLVPDLSSAVARLPKEFQSARKRQIHLDETDGAAGVGGRCEI